MHTVNRTNAVIDAVNPATRSAAAGRIARELIDDIARFDDHLNSSKKGSTASRPQEHG